MRTFCRLLGLTAAAGLCFVSSAFADSGDQPAAGGETPAAGQQREPLKEIPAPVPNADKRIEESLRINTEALHGFSKADLDRESAQHIAMLTGATPGDAASSHPSISGYGDYRIGAGDELEFVSFDDENLNRTITVRYDGYVSLPRVKDIKVAGLTRPAAEAEMKRVYGEIYRDPELSLTITNPASKAYVVTGDVQTPGRYAYTQNTSLWDAISYAGGLRLRNNSSGSGFVAITGQITKAFVIRRLDDKREVFSYDLRGFGKTGDYQGDVPIFYGDIVYVPEGVNLVYLLGESRSPVIVELTEGMSLLQMLALSGGFNTSTARLSEVVLLRAVDDETTEVHRVNIRTILKNKEEDIALQPGDIVYIPQKKLLRLQEFVQRFTGTISPLFGLYGQAIDSVFAYSLNKETLDALENNNAVAVNPINPPQNSVTRLPRVISPTNIGPTNLNP